MLLYLVQHGEAKKEEEDPARGLTDKGVRDVGKTAAFAQKADVKIDRIFYSGKTRARQTAELFADVLKPQKGPVAADNLAPLDDPAVWASQLAQEQENTMLVGHLPFMTKLAGLLLCEDKEKACIDFRMGGIVCLKRSDDGKWALAWMVVPEMLG